VGKWRHGEAMRGSRTPEYLVWATMVQRCTNPKSKKFKDYGGRGITVCERWMTYADFIADMGHRPSDALLERINNNGNEQANNRRPHPRRAYCKKGHPLTPDNIYREPSNPRKHYCLTCARARWRRKYWNDSRGGNIA
jgi:hypothetical protein